MKKLLCVLFVLMAASLMAQSVWFDGTWDEAKTIASKENKMILVDFYSDG